MPAKARKDPLIGRRVKCLLAVEDEDDLVTEYGTVESFSRSEYLIMLDCGGEVVSPILGSWDVHVIDDSEAPVPPSQVLFAWGWFHWNECYHVHPDVSVEREGRLSPFPNDDMLASCVKHKSARTPAGLIERISSSWQQQRWWGGRI